MSPFYYDDVMGRKVNILNMDCLVPVSSTSGEQRTVRDIRIDNHLTGKPLELSTVAKSDTCAQAPHPVVYEKIGGHMILSVSLSVSLQ